MAGSINGALQVAAKRIGVPFATYLAQIAAGQKYCFRCRQWKPKTEFGLDESRGDGRAAQCTSCRRAPARQIAFTVDQNEQQRHRYHTDAEYRHTVIQRVRARKRALDPLPAYAAQFLLAQTDGLCLYCENEADSWDHLVPVVMGGKTEPGNVYPCCLTCNSRKRNFHVADFIKRYRIQFTTRLENAIAHATVWGALTIGAEGYPQYRAVSA